MLGVLTTNNVSLTRAPDGSPVSFDLIRRDYLTRAVGEPVLDDESVYDPYDFTTYGRGVAVEFGVGPRLGTRRAPSLLDYVALSDSRASPRSTVTETTPVANFFSFDLTEEESRELTERWSTAVSGAHSSLRVARALRFYFRLYSSRRANVDRERIVAFLRDADATLIASLLHAYREPFDGNNLLAQLTSVFMHARQQGGLNAKHASLHGGAGQSEREDRSRADFDPKLFIEMSTSCLDRHIVELMLAVPQDALDSLDAVRSVARAWRLYDCGDEMWLRVEIARARVNEAFEAVRADSRSRVVYTSDKNVFDERNAFVSNFLSYYLFYYNNETPPSFHGLDPRAVELLEMRASVIYFYALVNWRMIEMNRSKQNRNNSISVNTQSLCKSNDNPMYAVFSENSIARVVGERSARSMTVNSPYVNRGLSYVSRLGVNVYEDRARVRFYRSPLGRAVDSEGRFPVDALAN